MDNNSKKKKVFLIIIILVSLTSIGIGLPKYVLPQINVNNATKAFDSQNYEVAVEYYEKSKLQNEKEYNGKYLYSIAMVKFNNKLYKEAAKIFNTTGGILESNKKIFDSGMELIKSQNFKDAKKCFELLSTNEAKAYKNYCSGMISYNNKDYKLSIENLLLSKEYIKDIDEFILEVYFQYGLELYSEKKYDDAKVQFQNAKKYPKAEEYVKACELMKAEGLFKEGKLGEAKNIFSNLPKDFVFENVSVKKRNKQLEDNKNLLELCGKWGPSHNYIESRNIHRSTGIWNNWFIDEVSADQSLDIQICINDNGKINIEGNVCFFRFTNYSSLAERCQATQVNKRFSITNVDSIPCTYKIDDNTELQFSAGKFKIKYTYRDEYSAYFYNLYNSDITFGNKTVSY